ncbi:MAG: YceI family protein [Thermoleophilia bacterium]
MSISAGTYRLGPADGTLALRTGRAGAAAKAGHDLLIHVDAWEAVLEVGADGASGSLTVDVDSSSLRVVEGTGGLMPLGDDDRSDIKKTIDDEILKRQPVTFRSTRIAPAADGLSVSGDLTLLGTARPVAFDLAAGADGALTAAATLTQSDWGIKPYSALFGALKVADDVAVELDARLPQG